jgi:hypothetical protein
VAVGLFNRASHDALCNVAWESLGLHDRRRALVRDLWAREDAGEFAGSYAANVPPHGAKMLRITPRG